MKPGHWFFIPAGAESFHEQFDDLDLISIHFNAELFSQVEIFQDLPETFTAFTPEWEEPLQHLRAPSPPPTAPVVLQRLLWQRLEKSVGGYWHILTANFKCFSNFMPLLEHFSKFPCKNFSATEMVAFMKMGKESFLQTFFRKDRNRAENIFQ